MVNSVYLLLGSNLGDSKSYIENAKSNILQQIGLISKQSSYYSTAAWGQTEQSDFINQVILVDTHLNATDTIEIILNIEAKMGRVRKEKNEPRLIDIDILFFNNDILNSPSLTIPHPLLQERNFVLQPMNELSPAFMHPIFNKTINELMILCKDNLAVKKIDVI